MIRDFALAAACRQAPAAWLALKASRLATALVMVACSGPPATDDVGSTTVDTGTPADSAPLDGGVIDAGAVDAGAVDAGAAPDAERRRVPATPEEEALLLGDDRVRYALRGRLGETLDGPLAIARALGADSACARPNVHVAIERQTRLRLHSYVTEESVPRVVLTACEGDAHEIFVVHTSPASPDDAADPLRGNATTEVMALDRTTHRYNFNAIERQEGDAFTLRRWLETDGGEIRIRSKAPDAAMTDETDFEGGCFYCHATGSPILLETDPFGPAWPPPETLDAGYEGWTAAFVAEADAAATLADAVDAGTRAHIGDGWATALIDGTLAGGLGRLVRPLFCPSEYQLVHPGAARVASSFLVDPTVAGSAPALLDAAASIPALPRIPIRAVADRHLEAWLLSSGILSEEVVIAARLIGGSDLSRDRCAIFEPLRSSLPSSVDALDDVLRAALEAHWREAAPSDSRALALRLLDSEPGAADALATYRTQLAAELTTAALAVTESQLRDIARARATWMRERFDAPFALNPLIYEDWLE